MDFMKLSGSNRLFLFLVPLFLVFGLGVFYLSGRKALSIQSYGCCEPEENATGEFEEGEGEGIFANQRFEMDYDWINNYPAADLLALESRAVLGASSDERWIEIDLSEQTLYAHNGDAIDYQFLISGGKWAPTPTGEYRVWIKLKYTKMSGGNKEDHTYYYLPNVPYVQYFYKGYGLHGAYWHNNFGIPMSHGCVNLSIPDAEKLFYWTSPPVGRENKIAHASRVYPGTKIVIHD